MDYIIANKCREFGTVDDTNCLGHTVRFEFGGFIKLGEECWQSGS